MAKMTKSELDRYLKENQKDTTYKDMISSGIKDMFSVDEGDGFIERTAKGAGEMLFGSTVSTGAVAEGLLSGKIDPSELDFDDFMNAVYSVPALKGLAASPKIAKEAFKVAQKGGKGGFKKAIDFVGEKLGPSKKKPFVGPNKPGMGGRTSKGQLADMVGLGKSPAGKTKLGALGNRAAKLGAAGLIGGDLLDRSSAVPEPESESSSMDPGTASEKDSAVDLDNPGTGMPGQGQGVAPGSAAAAINASNEMPGSGRPSKLADFSQDYLKKLVQNEAIRKTQNEIAANKKADRLAGEEAHRADVRANSPEYGKMESLYDSTGGRDSGDWENLSQKQKDDAFRQFNLNRGAARDKKARIQKVLDEEDQKHIAAGKPGPLPSEGFMYANEDNNFFDDGSVSKEKFSEKTGLERAGTSIMQHADGTFSPREFDGAFERAGGMDSAKAFLDGKDPSGEKMAALQHQVGGDKVYRYDSGDLAGEDMGLDVEKDAVVFGADKASYPGSNFETYDEAAAYLNRPTLENPDAPEAPAPAPEEEDGGGVMDYLKYAPFALPLLTKGKVKPKIKPKGPTSLAKPAPEYVNATPIPGPTYISKTPALPNRAPGLPNRAPGLPNKPLPLANNRPVSMQNPAQATPEQFRRMQSGMDPTGRRLQAQYAAQNAPRPVLKNSLGVPPSGRTRTNTLRDRALEEQRRQAQAGINF